MSLAPAFQLRLQSVLGALTSWMLAPLYFLFIKFRGYRIRDLEHIRRRWAGLMDGHRGPWLICGNHLTLIDSVIMIYALVSLGGHVMKFQRLPWNLPERANFQRSLFMTVLCYLSKCIPVSRGGDREEMQATLAKCNYLLERRQIIMVFPEGGRSRSGRVDTENFSYGVGRFLQDHRDCRVLCVYMRGDGQATYGDLPRRGDTFTVTMDAFLPGIPAGQGLRAQRDLAGRIVHRLAQMEEDYFDQHRQRYCRFDQSGQHREKPGPALHCPRLHSGGTGTD
jgi:1-acyl-sn-glycerol-3-phosphate acyltransferase